MQRMENMLHMELLLLGYRNLDALRLASGASKRAESNEILSIKEDWKILVSGAGNLVGGRNSSPSPILYETLATVSKWLHITGNAILNMLYVKC